CASWGRSEIYAGPLKQADFCLISCSLEAESGGRALQAEPARAAGLSARWSPSTGPFGVRFPMPQLSFEPAPGIPRWLVFLGSLAIAVHFLAVVCGALAAPSGPWPTMEGSGMATPPQFAFSIDKITRPYLQLVKMTHNYHFATNRPGLPGASFEVRLKDESGQELAMVRFPDAGANFWVHHRQSLLAQGLADDQPVQPPTGEVIAAPQQVL